MPTFGELLGAEMLAQREAKGMTQLAVAERAFGPGSDDRQIRRYETGEINRPQAKTFQPICETLGISRQRIGELKAEASNAKDVNSDEIDALRVEKGSLEQALSDLQTLSRGQLETIATRFEVPRAFDMTDPALIDLLGKKAQDYRALRAEIDAINPALKRLSNLKAAASAAIEDGNLDEVETLLSLVQSVELDEAAKTAELRANNALLRDKVDQAYQIFCAAAESFAAIDQIEVFRRRCAFFEPLYDHGLRYGGNGLSRAINILTDPRVDFINRKNPLLWASIQNGLGLALQHQGSRNGGDQRKKSLEKSISNYREALAVFTKLNNLEGCAMTSNNLANALANLGASDLVTNGDELLAEAVAGYRDALIVYTMELHPLNWAMTQNNLANAQSNRGRLALRSKSINFLQHSVSAYHSALDIYKKEAMPIQWAMIQNNLGNPLSQLGAQIYGVRGTRLLSQAIESYHLALEIRTKDAHPVEWAMTQKNLALAEAAIATRPECPDPKTHLQAALAHVENALKVFDPDHMPYDHEKATNHKRRIETALGKL